MLLTLAFAGCQDTNPSMTIVSLQIDSDEENTWLYLYSIPRVKMGNLTIFVGGVNETLSSVFSHQTHISMVEMENITDEEGYFDLYVAADLKKVYWEYSCKVRISQFEDNEDDKYIAEVLHEESEEGLPSIWNLRHNKALEFRE